MLVIDTLSEYELPHFLDVDSAAAWFAEVAPEKFKIALRVPSDEVDRALRWAWAIRPVVVVIEETDLYAPPGDVCDGLKFIVEYGRRFHLGLVAVTRRPFAVDRRITANARFVVLFPTAEPRDRVYFSQLLPQTLVAQAFEHLDAATLPGEYVVIDLLQRSAVFVSRRAPSEHSDDAEREEPPADDSEPAPQQGAECPS